MTGQAESEISSSQKQTPQYAGDSLLVDLAAHGELEGGAETGGAHGQRGREGKGELQKLRRKGEYCGTQKIRGCNDGKAPHTTHCAATDDESGVRTCLNTGGGLTQGEAERAMCGDVEE